MDKYKEIKLENCSLYGLVAEWLLILTYSLKTQNLVRTDFSSVIATQANTQNRYSCSLTNQLHRLDYNAKIINDGKVDTDFVDVSPVNLIKNYKAAFEMVVFNPGKNSGQVLEEVSVIFRFSLDSKL